MAFTESNTVEAYVRDLLDTFSKQEAPDLTRLLPNTWLATHPQARRNWAR